MATIPVVHEHRFHSNSNNRPVRRRPQIKQRPPPLTLKVPSSSPRKKTEKTPPALAVAVKPVTSQAHLLNLLNRTLNAGAYDKAIRYLELTFSAGHRPEISTCKDLITALSSSSSTCPGNLRRAERVIEILELHGSTNSFIYNSLLKALCRSRGINAALSLLRRMSRHRCPPDAATYNILIGALCSNGRLGEAVDLFRAMTGGCYPNVITYNILIESHLSEGRVSDATRLLDELLARGLKPDDYTYNAILKGVCKEGHVDFALQLLLSSSNSNPSSSIPDLVSYNIVLNELLKKKRWRDAASLVSEMAASRGLSPDVRTYNTLVRFICRDGKIDVAIGMLGHMLRRGMRPNSHSLNIVMSAYCKKGRLDLAVAFMEHVVACGCSLDIVSYNVVISALCDRGEWRVAMEVLRKLEGVGCKPDIVSYNSLIHALWMRGRRRMALELVEEIAREGVLANEITYVILVRWLCRDGLVDEAVELVRDVEVVRPREVVMPREVAEMYNAVVVGLCKAGRLVEAIDVFMSKMMGNAAWPNDATYLVLVRGIGCLGYKAEAAELASALIRYNVISRKSKRRIRVLSGLTSSSASTSRMWSRRSD